VTVSSNPFPLRYDGNDVTVDFQVPTLFLQESDGTAHLRVIKRAIDGTETTLVQETDYTVSGAESPVGGTVQLNTAPATGEKVVIYRSVPLTQETDYIENDPFPAESHEKALDKITHALQQQAAGSGADLDTSRVLTLGATDVDGSGSYQAKGNKIANLANPTADQDAATKDYVDDAIAGIGTEDPLANAVTRWEFAGDGITSEFDVTDVTDRTAAGA